MDKTWSISCPSFRMILQPVSGKIGHQTFTNWLTLSGQMIRSNRLGECLNDDSMVKTGKRTVDYKGLLVGNPFLFRVRAKTFRSLPLGHERKRASCACAFRSCEVEKLLSLRNHSDFAKSNLCLKIKTFSSSP